ncbi:MAG: hypothetical protein K1Y36_12935 [Blastocatellia bacterium]|nr:hypothetical protein [Blastocatellia bacterium]
MLPEPAGDIKAEIFLVAAIQIWLHLRIGPVYQSKCSHRTSFFMEKEYVPDLPMPGFALHACLILSVGDPLSSAGRTWIFAEKHPCSSFAE